MVIKGTRLGLFVFLDHKVNMPALVVLLSTVNCWVKTNFCCSRKDYQLHNLLSRTKPLLREWKNVSLLVHMRSRFSLNSLVLTAFRLFTTNISNYSFTPTVWRKMNKYRLLSDFLHKELNLTEES